MTVTGDYIAPREGACRRFKPRERNRAGAGTEVEDVHALADIRVMKIEDIRAELRQHLIRPSKRRKPELILLLAAARKKAKEVPPDNSRA